MESHIPVMLKQTINSLDLKPNGLYVDLTLGRAGHASEILKKIPFGKLIGVDKDLTAIKASQEVLSKINKNFELIHTDFKHLKSQLNQKKINQVDGILVDLGVSSPQLDTSERGFSYNKEAKLDMRMDQSQSLDAHNVINTWTSQDLQTIFKDYADVKLAYRVANAIVKNRPIETTVQLANLVRQSLPATIIRNKNVVRQIFQAVRIAVNDEIETLKIMLDEAVTLLKPTGKLAIITFHSLEDRIVKQKFAKLSEDKTGKLPIKEHRLYSFKTYKPTPEEILTNRRSRSARLRILTKLS